MGWLNSSPNFKFLMEEGRVSQRWLNDLPKARWMRVEGRRGRGRLKELPKQRKVIEVFSKEMGGGTVSFFKKNWSNFEKKESFCFSWFDFKR